MKIFLTLLLSSLLLTNCATQPFSPEELNQINRIGVISLLGDDLDIRYVGLTVFNNWSEMKTINEWKIDEYIIDNIKKRLSTNPQIDFTQVKYDAKSLSKTYKSMYQIPYRDFNLKYIQEDLNKIITEHQLNAYILVTKLRFQAPLSYSHNVDGYGIFQRDLKIYKETALYIVAKVSIMDAKTHKKLRSFNIISNKKVDNSYFIKDTNFSQNNLNYISDWLKQELNENLNDGLIRLALIQ